VSSKPLLDIGDKEWHIVEAILQRHVPDREVWAFGSRAKWTAKEFSDLDLAILGETSLTLDESAALADAFAESDLPWKVDVVEWATTSPSFRKIIKRDKVVVKWPSKVKTFDSDMTSEWQVQRLDQIAEINPTRKVRKGNVVPFVDMAALPQLSRDISTDGVIAREAKGAGAHFQNGDTLLARITPCLENGKTAQVRCLDNNAIAEGSTEFIVLCGKDTSDNDFIYYLCREPTFREYAIGRMEGTSGRQRVSWQSIAAYEFPLPPPEKRREIARVLSALDDRITLLRETNTTVEAIAQALFKSWFVDFDPVHAKMQGRAPDGMDEATVALFPDGFEESELGNVPAGWQVMPVGDAVETAGGATPDTKVPEYWEPAEHYWTTPKDLSGIASPILLSTERKLSDAGLKKISSGLLPVGSLLMSSRAPIGYLALTNTPMAINQGYIAIPPGGKLSSLYMLLWCQTNMDNIKGRANGSTFMEISKKAFRPIPALVPSKNVLDAFEAVAASLFDRLIENEKQAQTLVMLRDTLLPRLLSGQISLEKDISEELII
jgi:type I restriction enzyme S subunit